jgi:hypothetical protein
VYSSLTLAGARTTFPCCTGAVRGRDNITGA